MVLAAKKQKTPPIHHRKRHGRHHKRNDDYHKPYWPYLPLLGIIGLGFIFNVLWTPLSQTVLSTRGVLSYATNTSISGLLAETNAQRANNSAANLQLNSQLTAAAQAKANDMAARNYWSHETPDGAEPWVFLTNAGYNYAAAGENLAYGFDSSAATVTGWMNSTGHRANLINTVFQEVGFGIANAADYQSHGQQTIIVAMYGTLAAPSAAQIGAMVGTPSAAEADQANKAASQSQAPAEEAAPVASQDPAAPAASAPAAAAPTAESATAAPQTVTTPTTTNQPQKVTRLELASSSIPTWSIALTSYVILVLASLFIVRHIHFLHRYLIKGERFVVKHPAFDIAIVSIIVIGAVLTRTAGFIN